MSTTTTTTTTANTTNTTSLTNVDDSGEAESELRHQYESVQLLVYIGLLITTVFTVYLIKHFRLRYIHETGLSILYGMAVGALIQYAHPKSNGSSNTTTTATSGSVSDNFEANSVPPLWEYMEQSGFSPEIFFYVLLPPIIFNAGYSMKRRHFFRNFGAIIAYAFAGTLISAFTIGGMLYGFAQLIPDMGYGSKNDTVLTFKDSLYYGSIISATDPVTVLAIFHDLNVDVDLYALVFGESVLNDAVAIVLSDSVSQFNGEANVVAGIFTAIGLFIGKFFGAFIIGSIVGCINALVTKFTKIGEFPLLESSLFVLMSYASYLIAEATTLSGIVAVLFCGIFQAHYTFNNLSDQSKKRTKELMELLSFLTENFVFLYIGVSMFFGHNFERIHWNGWFVGATLLAMFVSRALNIYPLSALLNCGRRNKISYSFQHMMMFSGLRGAVAFALIIRHAKSGIPTSMKNVFLTTTIVLVMVTVIVCGVFTLRMLTWLKIAVGVDDHTQEQHAINTSQDNRDRYKSTSDSAGNEHIEMSQTGSPSSLSPVSNVNERAEMVKAWNSLDNNILKPILTNYRMTLADNYPNSRCCSFFSRCFSTTNQIARNAERAGGGADDGDSDCDIIIENDEMTLAQESNGSSAQIYAIDAGDLGITPLTGRSAAKLEFNI